MARFSFNDAANYGSGVSNFLSLKNDRDTARVRFLLNDLNDLYGVSTHEIEVDGKKVDVECLRTYNEPVDKCPLCAAGYNVNAKLFIPVYDEDAGVSKIWTRGKTYFERMSNLCSRYNPLVATSFDIVRLGKKGDTSTTYEIYPVETTDARVSDYPHIDMEGTAFECKDYNSLQNFVQTGTFVNNNNNVRQPQGTQQRQIPIRRTPTRNEEDAF